MIKGRISFKDSQGNIRQGSIYTKLSGGGITRTIVQIPSSGKMSIYITEEEKVGASLTTRNSNNIKSSININSKTQANIKSNLAGMINSDIRELTNTNAKVRTDFTSNKIKASTTEKNKMDVKAYAYIRRIVEPKFKTITHSTGSDIKANTAQYIKPSTTSNTSSTIKVKPCNLSSISANAKVNNKLTTSTINNIANKLRSENNSKTRLNAQIIKTKIAYFNDYESSTLGSLSEQTLDSLAYKKLTEE